MNINLKNDDIFKYVFSYEYILRDFINSFLEYIGEKEGEPRIYKYIRLIKAGDLEEMSKVAKGDKIMEDVVNYVRLWNKESHEERKREMIEEAENKGEAKGKRDRNIEIAKNMLRKEIPINDISEITGLTIKEINKLKNY